MKKINKYIIVCMLFSFCLSNTVAQTKGNISDIRSNWYIEVGAGAQVLFSADASKLSFGDRITPSISVAGGKWFSPYWGTRVQVQGYSFNGNSTTNGLYLGNFVYLHFHRDIRIFAFSHSDCISQHFSVNCACCG